MPLKFLLAVLAVLAIVPLTERSAQSAPDKDCMMPSNLKSRGYDCKQVGDFGNPNHIKYKDVLDDKPIVRDFRSPKKIEKLKPVARPTPARRPASSKLGGLDVRKRKVQRLNKG